jgi:hypothetical protein
MAPRGEVTMDVRAAPVQSVANGPRSRPGVSALVPVLVLVLVAGAARAGMEPPARSLEAALDPVPSQATVDGQMADRGRGYPAQAYGRPVMTGLELSAARAAGQVGRELVAVSGLLHNDPLALACPAIRITFSRTFCRRLMAIFPEGWGTAGAGGASTSRGGPAAATPVGMLSMATPLADPTLPPALMAQLLPGAPVPVILASDSDLAPWLTGAVPVVAVGHFEDARAPACGPGREWCGDDLVIEQVVWLDGAWLAAETARDPGIPPAATADSASRAQEIFRRAESRAEDVLSFAIIGSRLLAIVDARAAAVVGPDRPGALWYVRSVVRAEAGAPAEVVWAVIDDATGRILGYSMPTR